MTSRVVIVGSSVGGVRTAQALRSQGYDGDVVLVGEETALPYDKRHYPRHCLRVRVTSPL